MYRRRLTGKASWLSDICNSISNLNFRALVTKITELENKIFSLELAHVTDTVEKECQLAKEASNCCETHPDHSCGEADQLLDTYQVFDHNDTTDVV